MKNAKRTKKKSESFESWAASLPAPGSSVLAWAERPAPVSEDVKRWARHLLGSSGGASDEVRVSRLATKLERLIAADAGARAAARRHG